MGVEEQSAAGGSLGGGAISVDVRRGEREPSVLQPLPVLSGVHVLYFLLVSAICVSVADAESVVASDAEQAGPILAGDTKPPHAVDAGSVPPAEAEPPQGTDVGFAPAAEAKPPSAAAASTPVLDAAWSPAADAQPHSAVGLEFSPAADMDPHHAVDLTFAPAADAESHRAADSEFTFPAEVDHLHAMDSSTAPALDAKPSPVDSSFVSAPEAKSVCAADTEVTALEELVTSEPSAERDESPSHEAHAGEFLCPKASISLEMMWQDSSGTHTPGGIMVCCGVCAMAQREMLAN